LPWLLAGFLVMIFLVPFDAIIFKVHMPANATFDRVFLMLMLGVFLVSRTVNERKGPRRRLTPVEIAMLVFGGLALLSIVLNIDRIYQQNELSFVNKQLSQLIAYGAFFFVVIASIRPEEVPAFTRLVMALACITAVGVIYESRSGVNLFYSLSGTLLGPFAQVAGAPTDNAKVIVSGPTQHGLALASMLTIALPFAVLPLLEARRPSERLKYLVMIGLILAADLSTKEKTATFAPIAAFLVLAAYKRQILRWVPVAIIVLIPVIHVAAPGALGGISQILPTSGSGGADYTDGRAYDYPAVAPDILNNLVLGRGYGTMDTQNYRIYRILDNQYLGTLFQVGVLGLLSYLGIVVFGMFTAHGVIRKGGVRGPPALAASAGCAAFGLLSATYDAAAFPQAVYSFLFVAGLVAALASKQAQPQPASATALRVDNTSGRLRRTPRTVHPVGLGSRDYWRDMSPAQRADRWHRSSASSNSSAPEN
jgi:O-antigen ligase